MRRRPTPPRDLYSILWFSGGSIVGSALVSLFDSSVVAVPLKELPFNMHSGCSVLSCCPSQLLSITTYNGLLNTVVCELLFRSPACVEFGWQ